MNTGLKTLPRNRSAQRVARGLGWVSIGLGLAEVLMPRAIARTLGMRGKEPVIVLCGLREIATGIGILAARNPAPWVWSRVAGDALDITTLGLNMDDDNPRRGNTTLALAAVAGVAAVDVACAQSLSAAQQRAQAPARDYSDRRGLPLPPAEMRGTAREDFEMPHDMRAPEAMRPYSVH